MDLSETIAPKSDQLNAEDLLAGPRTFTVAEVARGSDEQPVNVHLVELPGRPYRPSKSMRRILVAVWGKDASVYTGRRLTLYRDPDVTFGRDAVGGIKISHMSHLDQRMSVALTVKRGQRKPHTVDPLTAAPPSVTAEQVSECGDIETLRKMWHAASPDLKAAIEAKVGELQQPPPHDAEPQDGAA